MNSIKKILFTEDQLKKRVAELGAIITADYADTKDRELIFIGILRGCIVFYSDLIRCVNRDVLLDFMSVSSYGMSHKTNGEVRLLKDCDESLENKDVIIVEDIIDTGLTLSFLKKTLASRHPHSLKVACLLDKPDRRETDLHADYVGFIIPDDFVVGYGLDYAQHYRNLPYIGIAEITESEPIDD